MSDAVKVCSKCKAVKPLADFYVDKRTPDKHTPACAACNRAANQKWRAANPDYFTHWHRVNRLGTLYTAAELAAMLEAQGGVCAICKLPETERRNLALDHDHVTGKTRGFLCRKCNTGIGMLGDTAESLRRALNYLESHAEQ